MARRESALGLLPVSVPLHTVLPFDMLQGKQFCLSRQILAIHPSAQSPSDLKYIPKDACVFVLTEPDHNHPLIEIRYNGIIYSVFTDDLLDRSEEIVRNTA